MPNSQDGLYPVLDHWLTDTSPRKLTSHKYTYLIPTSLCNQKLAYFWFQRETQPSFLFLEGAWFTVQNVSTFFSKEKILEKFQGFQRDTSTCSFRQLACNTGHRHQLPLLTGKSDNIYKVHLKRVPCCQRIKLFQHAGRKQQRVIDREQQILFIF